MYVCLNRVNPENPRIDPNAAFFFAEFNPEAARFQKVPLELVTRPNLRPLGSSAQGSASYVRAV